MVFPTFVTTKKTLIGYSRLRMTEKSLEGTWNLSDPAATHAYFMSWVHVLALNCGRKLYQMPLFTPPHSSCFTSCFKAWRRCQPPPPQRGGSCSAAPVFKTHLFWSWNVHPTFLSLPPRHSPRAISVMLTKCRISFGPESWYASYYRGHVLSQWGAGFAGRYWFNEGPSGVALF